MLVVKQMWGLVLVLDPGLGGNVDFDSHFLFDFIREGVLDVPVYMR